MLLGKRKKEKKNKGTIPTEDKFRQIKFLVNAKRPNELMILKSNA